MDQADMESIPVMGAERLKEQWAEGTVREISEQDADVEQVRDVVEGFKSEL